MVCVHCVCPISYLELLLLDRRNAFQSDGETRDGHCADLGQLRVSLSQLDRHTLPFLAQLGTGRLGIPCLIDQRLL